MIVQIKDFVPEHTFDCGQCFRWERQSDGSYIGVANGQVVRISAENDSVTIDGCTLEDYENFWRTYLDADRDYSEIKKAVSTSSVMAEAVSFGYGIRILRQDFFETLISFIISQRSSIPKIRSCVEKLCRMCGEKLTYGGKTYYSFPAPKRVAALTEEELRSIGVGYRAPYILKAATAVLSGEVDIEKLSQSDTQKAREELLRLYGVGDKVCDCVLLFSLARYDLFPADVWIKRVMAEDFDMDNAKKSGEALFGGYSGFAQQYLFYWKKYNKES